MKFEAKKIKETEKAARLSYTNIYGGQEEAWVPKSLLNEVEDGLTEVPDWFLRKNVLQPRPAGQEIFPCPECGQACRKVKISGRNIGGRSARGYYWECPDVDCLWEGEFIVEGWLS